MDFAEWLQDQESNDIASAVLPYINQWKNAILGSMKVQDGYISFSFPQTSAQPMLQAAWYIPDLNEAAKTGGWGKEGGKGTVAYNKIQPYVQHWSGQDVASFKRGLTAHIRDISQEMGYLFETEAYLYLVDAIGLKPLGQDVFDVGGPEAIAGRVRALRDEWAEKIRRKGRITPRFAELVIEFVRLHATGPLNKPTGMPNGMGHLMYQKTVKLLGRKCKVDSVMYTGGAGYSNDKSDIHIGCENAMQGVRSDIGYTMKFGSEPTQQVASSTFGRAFALLSGDKNAARNMLSQVRQLEGRSKVSQYLELLGPLVKQRFENKPRLFVKLLEYLVKGKGDVLPAVRYYTRNLGEPGWSGAFKKDLRTREGQGKKLAPHMNRNPQVTVRWTPNYLVINMTNPKGPWERNYQGISIEFWPDIDETVNIKATQLASLGGRGY
jgi:hypothetical protein